MKTELDLVLEKNILHSQLLCAMRALDSIIKNKSLKKMKCDERLRIEEGENTMSFSFNNHSVWMNMHSGTGLVLYYLYSPLSDSYRPLACEVKIMDKLYEVDIRETVIHKEFVSKLRKLAFQMKKEIQVENAKHEKKTKLKNESSLELIKRSNLSQLFEIDTH